MKPLMTRDDEEELFKTLIQYYKNIYPGLAFQRVRERLTRQQIAEICYTYPGEENTATFKDRVIQIRKAIKEKGYDTPVIILRKLGEKKDILLDGHRRLKVAWEESIDWDALIMVPSRELDFGIEKMIEGKIRQIWG